MIKRILTVLSLGVAILLDQGSAKAATYQFYLENVSEVGHPSVTFTGFLDYNTLTNTNQTGPSPDFSISELVNGTAVRTWSTLTGSSSLFSGTPANAMFGFVGGSSGGGGSGGLDANASGINFSAGPVTLALSSGSFIHLPGMDKIALQGEVTDISPVPLPSSLPLFGSSILALAIYAWRRRGLNESRLRS